MLNIVQKKFSRFKVSALSVGKRKNDSSSNEDGWVATENTFAVIDGSAPRVDFKLKGKSSARFATDVVKNALQATPASLNGKELVDAVTDVLNKEIDKAGFRDIIQKTPEASPAALFIAARIVGNKLIVTALGDASGRINGKVFHGERFKTEELMTQKRIAAMKQARRENLSISEEELIKIGQDAITNDLNYQVRNYFNNPDSDLGLGIINGKDVPDKFIKTYIFNLNDINTLELFSDGYFILPITSEIEDWEKAFFAGEKEDPLRWDKYPAVKAVTEDMFSDDRTIMIVKRITSLV